MFVWFLASNLFDILVPSFFLMFILAYEEGQWQILEPIMTVEATAPIEFQSAVMQGLSNRNGIVLGTDSTEGYFTVFCEVE